MYIPQIDENAAKILRVVLDQAMDGYTLQAKTSLPDTEITQSLQFLKDNEFIGVEGSLTPDNIRSVYVWVPPGSKGNAQFAVRTSIAQKK